MPAQLVDQRLCRQRPLRQQGEYAAFDGGQDEAGAVEVERVGGEDHRAGRRLHLEDALPHRMAADGDRPDAGRDVGVGRERREAALGPRAIDLREVLGRACEAKCGCDASGPDQKSSSAAGTSSSASPNRSRFAVWSQCRWVSTTRSAATSRSRSACAGARTSSRAMRPAVVRAEADVHDDRLLRAAQQPEEVVGPVRDVGLAERRVVVEHRGLRRHAGGVADGPHGPGMAHRATVTSARCRSIATACSSGRSAGTRPTARARKGRTSTSTCVSAPPAGPTAASSTSTARTGTPASSGSCSRSPRDAIAAADHEPGFHDLARAPRSGAIDVYRLPAIASAGDWRSGSQVEATAALEPMLEPGRRVLVFGEPFRPGLGMHSVHQNQGDPRGSRWADENAIWQDGATMTLRPDGALDVFVSRFSSQSDGRGRPRSPAPRHTGLIRNPLVPAPVNMPVCTSSLHGDGSRPPGRRGTAPAAARSRRTTSPAA